MVEDLFHDRSQILEFFHRHGMLVSPAALNAILEKGLGDLIPKLLTKDILDQGYLDVDQIKRIMEGKSTVPKPNYEIFLPDIRVTSSVEDFRKLFVSRFEKLSRIISLSAAMRGSVDIRRAKKTFGEVKVVGMVTSVDITKNGHKRITIEDL
ncbi:MAG: DNA polymerase II small subunit, partial [Thermoplasmataceae archaeon]